MKPQVHRGKGQTRDPGYLVWNQQRLMQVKVKVKSLSHVRLFATPWTVAHQAPPSMGFSRQEYWSGLPFPSPGDLPNPGIEPRSPTLQADVLTSEPPGKNVLQWYIMDASKCCARILLKLSTENFCIWVTFWKGEKGAVERK